MTVSESGHFAREFNKYLASIRARRREIEQSHFSDGMYVGKILLAQRACEAAKPPSARSGVLLLAGKVEDFASN